MKSVMRKILQYGVTPAFLLLAAINFIIEKSGGGHQHAGAMQPVSDMADMSMMQHGLANTLSQFGLGSMWLMYLLMALAHISPYLRNGAEE